MVAKKIEEKKFYDEKTTLKHRGGGQPVWSTTTLLHFFWDPSQEFIFDANPPFPLSFLSGISVWLCVNILSVALRLTYSFMVLSTQITWGVFSGWSFLDWSVGAGPPSARVWLGPRLAPLSNVGEPVWSLGKFLL